MKKCFWKPVSKLICAVLLICMLAVFAGAADRRTNCGANCSFCPTIIVPGLGQSSVIVTDDAGNPVLDRQGNKISAFPAYLQTGKIIKTVLGPALASLFLQRDIGLSDAFAAVIDDSFGINTCDEQARPVGNVKTEKFMYSYAECSDYERDITHHHIPFDIYPTDLPKDHLYYFEYNSFGNHIGLAEELLSYIRMVQAQTGHQKINLVPLSQGASIVSAMLDYYPEIMDDLHKVMFVVPALDGSKIIGDVFNDRITFLNKEYLYNGFLENIRLLDAKTAGLIELLVRILPDEVVMTTLQKGVKHLVENVMIRSTGMWALCPSGDYPSAAERYLSSPEMQKIRVQTDRYYQAQLRSRENVAKLKEKGVQVFCVAEYDYALINVGESWNDQNGDFIIQLDSTSMGATAAKVGETLPDDYRQQGTFCSDPTHNHISPDRVVDASTGLLPDTTFYFKWQRHDLTQHNDIILKLAMQLIAHDDITDVYSSPDFPQFNYARNVQNLRALLETAENVNPKLLTKKNRTELAGAISQAKEVLQKTVDTPDAIDLAETRLTKILVRICAKPAELNGPNIFSPVSGWLYRQFGTDGYSEYPGTFIQKGMQILKGPAN